MECSSKHNKSLLPMAKMRQKYYFRIREKEITAITERYESTDLCCLWSGTWVTQKSHSTWRLAKLMSFVSYWAVTNRIMRSLKQRCLRCPYLIWSKLIISKPRKWILQLVRLLINRIWKIIMPGSSCSGKQKRAICWFDRWLSFTKSRREKTEVFPSVDKI